jgi:hypothetical protein
MPEEHGEREEHASSGNQHGFGGEDGFGEFHDEFGGQDEFSEFQDRGEFDDLDEGEADSGRVRPETGFLPGGYPPGADPPGGYPPPTGRRNGSGGGRGRRALLIALTAVLAGTAGFGLVAVALRDLTSSPAAASSSPSAPAPGDDGTGAGVPSSGAGTGTRLSPLGGGVPSLAPGATLQLEIAGPVTAVSASSITIGAGDRTIKAAVTRATAVTGKVTSVGGIKVGDVVSATITGADGKLTAQSIQDPASLPSAPGQ